MPKFEQISYKQQLYIYISISREFAFKKKKIEVGPTTLICYRKVKGAQNKRRKSSRLNN